MITSAEQLASCRLVAERALARDALKPLNTDANVASGVAKGIFAKSHHNPESRAGCKATGHSARCEAQDPTSFCSRLPSYFSDDRAPSCVFNSQFTLGEMMNSRKRIAKAERDLAHWSSRHNLDGQQSLEIKRAGDSLEQLVTELRDLKTGAEAEGDRRLALDCVRVLLSIDERRNASRTPRIDAEEGLCPVMDLGTQIRVAQTFLQRQSTYQGHAPEARHTVNPLECNRERSEPKQTSSGAVDKISQENEAKPAPPLTRNQPQSAANQLPASWLNPKW